MNKGIKYGLRFLGWLLSAILVVVLLVALLIQTQPVKRKIASFAENQTSRFMNGQMQLAKINGNFFSHLMLENILFTFEKDTLAHIAELNLHYNLWPLLHGQIEVESASIVKPFFSFKQNKDSTWNIQQIMKPGPEKTDSTQQSSWEINLPAFEIINGSIKTEVLDTLIPRKIENLNARASVYWSASEQSVKLKTFSLSTRKPDFELNQLAFEVSRDSSFIELKDFRLETAKNKLTGAAGYEEAPPETGSASFESTEIQLTEFDFFLPSLKIPATPVVAINAKLEKDSVHLNIKVKDHIQSIRIDAAFPNLTGFIFNPSDEELIYYITGKFDNIELAKWTGNPDSDYLIHGELFAKGEGLDPATARLDITGNLNGSVIEEKKLKEMFFEINGNNGDLKGLLRGKSEFGEFLLESEISSFQEQPVYQAKLIAKYLDLARLTGNEDLSSNINMNATIRGKEFDPNTLSANAEIAISDSRFQHIHMDTLEAAIQYENENIQVDSIRIQTETATLLANGNYSFKSNSDIRLTAEINSMEEFAPYFPVDGLETNGTINAHLWGTPDSLEMESTVKLNQNQYDEISLEQLNLDAKAAITPKDTNINIRVVGYDLRSGKIKLDSVTARVEGNPDSLFVKTKLANQTFETQLQTGIMPGEKIKFVLSEWDIHYDNQHWKIRQPPAIIEIDSLNYTIDNFKMAAGDAENSPYFFADGDLSRKGEENFKLEMGNIDVSKTGALVDLNEGASGFLNLNLKLTGTSGFPHITGNFILDEAAFNQYRFHGFDGNMEYNNNQFTFETQVSPADSGHIKISATLPLQLNLDTMGFHYNPKDSIDASLTIEKIPLAILQTIISNGNLTGALQGKVNVKGTGESPVPTGNIKLMDASVKIDKYGINYDDIRLNLNFQGNKVALDTFRIKSDDGSLTGNGYIDFKSELYKGNINQSHIELEFDKFNPVNHRQFNMQLSGNARIGGEKSKVIYGGDLKIPQANIYLPAILNMMGKMNVPEMPKPVLVQQIEKMPDSPDSMDIKPIEPTNSDSIQSDYFDHLQGKLRLRIPKNTWIKNENFRIEVSGELEIIKNNEFFELFGSVDVVRGQYDLLGKTFVINTGTIRFQGGEEMMPQIDITASYTFRNAQRIEQTLTVDISGTAETPEVNFKLDGNSISEGDALSYILFGKSMNELTIDEQENIAGKGSGSLAGKAAASILSSQITGFLGDKLNVDYIEVKAGEDFSNASIVVGKYITNDIFVSYEQRFGETNERDRTKYKVMLEYELFRFLFLELNNSSSDSGFDVLIKFDVK